MANSVSDIVIKALDLYPVKSCAGISLSQANLTQAGLMFDGVFDRSWAICKENNQVLTQRQNPKMALIQTQIKNGALYLGSASAGEIKLPSPETLQEKVTASVWKDQCAAFYAPKDISEWVREALKSTEELQLIAVDKASNRVFKDPDRFNLARDVNTNYFSDAAPYLLTNIASLDALNQRLLEKQLEAVDMRRFRSNITVAGLPPFSEHSVSQLAHKHYTFTLVDHCQRCIMTTVDPDSGDFSHNREPFMTIPELNGMPNKPKAPAFGVNVSLETAGDCLVNTGDQLLPRG